ncbi:MAG: hypothetical protein ONB48_14895 [candidate division KSB1 bacterium]|nr:hypothetical protein [candidate division KSB1 bacterium]MDZ7273474.1 hypothetical protein [candidate division KSB1 bacterium]MDZ7286934.1 hypothetical protein [candidate division KSB1 bacterium]MDZ7299713.1 hypothetical protein [candidate division KSB1 bacterium]MDZ7305652.1 hypothetical protein [candidate division KSB1 bacterium]
MTAMDQTRVTVCRSRVGVLLFQIRIPVPNVKHFMPRREKRFKWRASEAKPPAVGRGGCAWLPLSRRRKSCMSVTFALFSRESRCILSALYSPLPGS